MKSNRVTQDDINTCINKTEAEVIEYCKSWELRYRVSIRDGKGNMLTSDVRLDRMNLTIEKDIVIKITIG